MARKSKGRLYKRNGSKYYWLEYFVNGKRIAQSLKVTTEKDAKDEREKIMAPLRTANKAAKLRAINHQLQDAEGEAADAVEAARTKLKLADAWDTYLADRTRPQPGPIALKDTAQQWGKFTKWWLPRAEAQPFMEDVSPRDAAAFAVYLEEDGLGPSRYNKIVQTCARVFRILAPQCNGMGNPFAGLARKRLAPEGHRALSDDELRKVCGKAEGELRTLLAVGLYTALRLGDCCALPWDAVDLKRKCVTWQPGKTRTRTGKTLVIPIHPVLAAILQETPKDARRGPVLPELSALYARDRSAVSKRVQKHLKDTCKIDTKDGRSAPNAPPAVSFHSLRHTFVTHAAKAGVPLPVVQELCGHESAAIQRIYMHMGETETRSAIAALPDITSNPKKALAAPPNDEDVLERIRERLASEKRKSALKLDLLQILKGD